MPVRWVVGARFPDQAAAPLLAAPLAPAAVDPAALVDELDDAHPAAAAANEDSTR